MRGFYSEVYTAVKKQTFLPACSIIFELQQRSSLISPPITVLTPLDVTRAPCSAVNVLLWGSCVWAVKSLDVNSEIYKSDCRTCYIRSVITYRSLVTCSHPGELHTKFNRANRCSTTGELPLQPMMSSDAKTEVAPIKKCKSASFCELCAWGVWGNLLHLKRLSNMIHTVPPPILSCSISSISIFVNYKFEHYKYII